MNINLERLIGAVQEHFDNEQSYALEGKKKPYWKRTQEEKDSVAWHERNQHGSSNEVYDLCTILNLNINNLYTIARIARKWEQKHNWEKCFPAKEHEQKITEYLSKNEYPRTEKEYIHWNINRKAEKAAKKAA